MLALMLWELSVAGQRCRAALEPGAEIRADRWAKHLTTPKAVGGLVVSRSDSAP